MIDEGGFEKRLTDKIKNTLRDYHESYEEGAWERFEKKRKKSKNRLVFWFLSGGTVAILLVLLTTQMNSPLDAPQKANEQVGTDYKTSSPENASPKRDRNAFDKDSLTQEPIKENKGNTITETRVSNQLAVRTSQENEIEGKTDVINSRHVTNVGNRSGLTKVYVDSHEGVRFKNLEITSTFDIAIGTDLDPSLKSSQDLSLLFPNQPKTNPDATNKIEFGLQLAPSYGFGKGKDGTNRFTNFGAGITLNIPIDSERFSINTGVLFNSQDLSNQLVFNEASLFFGEEATIKQEKDINLYNLDVPIHINYKIPNLKNKVSLQAGWSSFVTFQENLEFRETTESDSFGTSSFTASSTSTSTRFVPFGTLNFSLGYRAPLTSKLHYQIQPFYKYPLGSLTTEDIKIASGGLSFVLIFSR